MLGQDMSTQFLLCRCEEWSTMGTGNLTCCQWFNSMFQPYTYFDFIITWHFILYSLSFGFQYLLETIDGRHEHTSLLNRHMLRVFHGWGCRMSKSHWFIVAWEICLLSLLSKTTSSVTSMEGLLREHEGKIVCPVWGRSGTSEGGSLEDRYLPVCNR